MNNEYNEYSEKLFWKVFKNIYLLNCIFDNKCCYKSKKFKTITSIDSMLKHKQYQILICKLKANENLNFKSTYRIIEKIYEIKDIELFKEINSLLLTNGYQEDVKILFDSDWDIKSADLFDLHLKYHPKELQTYITTSIDSIILYNNPKLIIMVLKILEQYINDSKPFTLTEIERSYFIGEYSEIGKHRDQEIIEEWIKMISNIPISSTSILGTREYKVIRGMDLRWYSKYQKLLPMGHSIKTSFDSKENQRLDIFKNFGQHGVNLSTKSKSASLVSNFCYGFDKSIKEHIEDVKGELGCISTSIDSVLLYFEFYYCNYHVNSKSKSIPTSIQTQIDIIIQNNKPYQTIKQLFQLLVNETKSIVLYARYLKEYNELIETIETCRQIQLLLMYFMTKTYNTNVLMFLLKKDLHIKLTSNYCEPYLDILFGCNQIDKTNIIIFYNTYKSQKSIIAEDIDKKPLDDLISTKDLVDFGNKQLHSILGNESSSKWKEIASNLIDNDKIVTIKDKETIDWLSDIETGGCSILNIRDTLHSKLKQMKLDFSTSELLEYARIKFKQVIPILDSNKKLPSIHILRTHDDIVSLINRLNESNFIDNENLFKYYMIQLIQFGSRNSNKYQRSICDNVGEIDLVLETMVEHFNIEEYSQGAYIQVHDDFNKYKIPTQQIINLSKIKVNVNHFPNATSYLLQTFIKLLNFDGTKFLLDNSNGKKLLFNEKAFKDRFHNRIYISKYSYKGLIDFIQYLIDKFLEGPLSFTNLLLILNFLYLKLIRVNNLTIDQIKTAYQLISNYIEINRSKLTSYYYLKTLSPIIASCITVCEDPTGEYPTSGSKRERPFLNYDIDTSVYTFEYIFSNRTNDDLNKFIDSTIMDIVKDSYNVGMFSKMLDNNNPRITLFLHYLEMELEKRKTNQIKEPFLNYQIFKLIIKTFDIESFIKFDNLLQQNEFHIIRENHNVVNGEQENANDSRDGEQNDISDHGEHENLTIKELFCNGEKPLLSSNMVEWLGEIIIHKDYSDYKDIINYLFKKYEHQLGTTQLLIKICTH
ncbi:hypothetical protein DDB_G0276403 [Dictyostelium discoideum AX4]|uniref:Uncharacterized protein n=1 Tax=Dictyostelium discoideum TaxID=44689 RepID=Q86HE0_DICDI|nr:hypothetical protein DDB_G0276403 [Dictyostelium discoideum AX4]EAL69155.1 hypothetical protein DDB_G0276403 [Dictyostelium discoideum AX4]|eukprot:XP_643095.1 hypothetical protein DDB_G0276403 [Dictyostelium discoideum AX4]